MTITVALICAALLLAGFAWYSCYLTADRKTRPSQHAETPKDEPDSPEPGHPAPPGWWYDAAPDPTIAVPHAVGTWGKTPQQIVAELDARYLK